MPTHAYIPLQGLRDNKQEQMDRGSPVYSWHCSVLHRDAHDYSQWSGPKSVLLPRRTDVRVPELRDN